MHSAIFIVVLFIPQGMWLAGSNPIVHYDLISIEGWSAWKNLCKIVSFYLFFDIDFLLLSMIYWFSSVISDLFLSWKCFVSDFLSTLPLLKYDDYGILFGDAHLISAPWRGSSFQGLFDMEGSLIEFIWDRVVRRQTMCLTF